MWTKPTNVTGVAGARYRCGHRVATRVAVPTRGVFQAPFLAGRVFQPHIIVRPPQLPRTMDDSMGEPKAPSERPMIRENEGMGAGGGAVLDTMSPVLGATRRCVDAFFAS